MIVIFTVTIGDVIIAEVSLSFLGLGLPSDVVSWGDAQLERTPIHGEGPGAGSLARVFPVHRRLGLQHVRRLARHEQGQADAGPLLF